MVRPCGKADFQLWTVVPVLGNGWSLLGEVDKWVALSTVRFQRVETSETDVTVFIRGIVGERVSVAFRSPDGDRIVVKCLFEETEYAAVRVPARTCVSE